MKTQSTSGHRFSLTGWTAVAVAAVAGMACLLEAPAARAQVAARVESQTRPNFGLLLDPAAGSRRHRQPRRWSYRDHRPDWRPDWGYGGPGYIPGGQQHVVVDCGGNPGSGAVEDAVRRVAPGGTLTIRDRGGACVGWLNVDKPMTIQGEGGYDPRTGARVPPATLQAPAGFPCITVAANVRVEIQDIVLQSPSGGDAACVVGDQADILIRRAAFRHVGDEAAIYVHGGTLDVRETNIDARTTAAAIVADAATLTAQTVSVTGAQSGIEISPGDGAPSTLWGVTLMGANTPNNFGPRAIGVVVRSRRDFGRVDISNSRICGYVEGVAIEGASVTIKESRICKSDKGAVLYSGELSLTGSRIRAQTYGVAAASGRAVVTGNVFAGVQDVFYREDRAVIEARNNRVWSRNDICRPTWRAVYRDRYAPQWDERPGAGWACQATPYPQQWWGEEDGSFGLPYVNDAWSMQGYDRFQYGYGWYDRDGRYVNDDRYWGDERWGQRPSRRDDRRRDDRRDDQRDGRSY